MTDWSDETRARLEKQVTMSSMERSRFAVTDIRAALERMEELERGTARLNAELRGADDEIKWQAKRAGDLLAEVERLEGLILDQYEHNGAVTQWIAFSDEALRIRALRGGGK